MFGSERLNKMKKFYIISYYGKSNVGGVERVVHYLYELLNSIGFTVKIVDKAALLETIWGRLLYKLLPEKLWIRAYPILNSLYIILNKSKQDIVIAHGFNLVGYPADYLFVHGNMLGYIQSVYGKKKWEYSAYYEKIAGKLAKRLISVSHNAKDEWISLYKINPNKFNVINNCVDVKRFIPISRANSHYPIKIIYVGRLEKGKNIDKILELAKNIESESKFNLTIITNNHDNTELFNGLSHTFVKVGLDIEEIKDEYPKHDIMFFPSLYEGFEMVTLEALASGIPVVGNKVGAVKELLESNFPGVHLLNNDYLVQLEEIANKYFDYANRLNLAKHVADRFSVEVYKDKLLKFMKV